MAERDQANINKLIQLARDNSARGRRRLLENISDLFLSEEGRLNDHERALMTDILVKLVESIETEMRREIAELLAEVDTAPRELIRVLANDMIEIARPILEQSKVLQDPDLIEIVKQRTDDHRLSIALRHHLSAEVSDALVEHGDEDVIEALLRNADAELSQKAMEYLVAESRRMDRFQEPLLTREDLPTPLAYRMFWWVSAALRRHILEHSDIDEVKLDSVVERAARSALATHDETDSAMARAYDLAKKLSKTGDLTINFLIQALRQQRVSIFIAGLAVLTSVDIAIARQIFNDHGGESLAVVCKAIGVDRSDFTSLFLLLRQARDGPRAQNTEVLNTVLSLFDSVNSDHAMIALNYWRQDSGYRTAINEIS